MGNIVDILSGGSRRSAYALIRIDDGINGLIAGWRRQNITVW